MSAEGSILALLAKYLWLVVSGIFGFFFAWLFRRVNNTYTKQETDERIELSLKEVLTTVRWHGEQIKRQNELLEKQIDKDNKDTANSARLEQKVESLIDRLDRERE